MARPPVGDVECPIVRDERPAGLGEAIGDGHLVSQPRLARNHREPLDHRPGNHVEAAPAVEGQAPRRRDGRLADDRSAAGVDEDQLVLCVKAITTSPSWTAMPLAP